MILTLFTRATTNNWYQKSKAKKKPDQSIKTDQV